MELNKLWESIKVRNEEKRKRKDAKMKERAEAVRQRMIIKSAAYTSINTSRSISMPKDDYEPMNQKSFITNTNCTIKEVKCRQPIEVKSFMENDDDEVPVSFEELMGQSTGSTQL